jgi:hypothetical protein
MREPCINKIKQGFLLWWFLISVLFKYSRLVSVSHEFIFSKVPSEMSFTVTFYTHEKYLSVIFYKQLVQDVLCSAIMSYKERRKFWLPQPKMLLTQNSSLIPAPAYMPSSWHRVKISSILTVLTPG